MASDIGYCEYKTTFSNSPISSSFECKWFIIGLSSNQMHSEAKSPDYLIAPGINVCFSMLLDDNGLFFYVEFKSAFEIKRHPFNAHFQSSLSEVSGRKIHSEFKSVAITRNIRNEEIVLNISKKEWEKSCNQNGNDFVFYAKVAISRLQVETVVSEMKNCNPHQKVGDMETSTLYPSGALQNLSQHFLDMYLNSVSTDLLLNIKGTKLPVHKAVLRSRSSVFNQMFEHSLAEETNNVVNIEDISVEIMTKLLEFMYSGKIVEYDYKTAYDLYEAGDKYDVSDLRKICCGILLKNVSIENVFDVMSLADRHHDVHMKTRAMKYITKNMKNIFSFDSWKKFALEEPVLAGEIVLNFEIKS